MTRKAPHTNRTPHHRTGGEGFVPSGSSPATRDPRPAHSRGVSRLRIAYTFPFDSETT